MPPLPCSFADNLTLGPPIGRGRRSVVYAGWWSGEPVVVKQYTPQSVRKYRCRYRVSIAQFEHDRNAAFYAVPDLRPFTAKPIAWTTSSAATGELFVQEQVDGIDLRELLDETGRLPGAVLRSIDRVVHVASGHGLYDIDMSPSNFRMQPDGDGWRPVLFDFNLMPQHLHAPNPFVALLYRTGLRHPAHRDRSMLQRLRTWPE